MTDLRVSQLGAEVWIAANPDVRVSQLGLEVWRAGVDLTQIVENIRVTDLIDLAGAHVSDVEREALLRPTPAINVSDISREALRQRQPPINVSEVDREALLQNTSLPVREGGIVREALRINAPAADFGGVVREVFRIDGPVRLSGFTREILRTNEPRTGSNKLRPYLQIN